MGKVVSTAAAIVGGVALIATGVGAIIGAATVTAALGGISAVALTAAAGVLSLGSSLLNKPKQPKMSAATDDRLNVSLNVRAPRVMVFGSTAMGTDLRDQEFSGADKEYLHRFIVNAAHRVTAVREIWFDDQLAWSSASGVQSKYAGYLTVSTILEGGPTNAINLGPRMGASRRFTGCAYTYLRFKLTGNSKKTESPFAQQVPTRVTIAGDGMPCYDPRQDSTVSGGSGPHRADDQATWTWGDHARNPAVQFGTWMLGWRIRNPQSGTWKLSVGCGISADRIDWQSIINGANLCDEPVTLKVGGFEPRYRSDGVFAESDDPTAIIEAFKACMNADVDDQDGLIRLTVFHNDLATPDADLTTDDVEGDYVWVQTPPLPSSYNVVRGTYIEPSSRSLYQPAPYDDRTVPSPDGLDRVHPADLGLVQSKSQAERLGDQRLQRQQYGGTFRAVFLAAGWKVQKNSIVRFTFAPEGWTQKLFRVAEIEVEQDGRVPLLLREEHAAIYAWDKGEGAAVEIAEPTLYEPGEAPIPQFLGGIEEGATVGATVGDAENPGNLGKPGGGTYTDDDIETSKGTSADTGAVGGRPSSEVLGAIDDAAAGIVDLIDTYGSTASAAASAAAALGYKDVAETAAGNAAQAVSDAQDVLTDSVAAKDASEAARDAAEQARNDAQDAAGDADDAAQAASGWVSIAEQHSDDAGTYATAAQASSISARTTVISSMPSDFAQEGTYFTGATNGSPESVPSLEAVAPVSFPTVNGAKVLHVSGNTTPSQTVRQIGALMLQPGRLYRARVLVRITALGSRPRVLLVAQAISGSWTQIAGGATAWEPTSTSTDWYEMSVDLDGDTAIAAGGVYATGLARVFGDGDYDIRSLGIEDVTESSNAADSAVASVDAAEAAAISKTDAGTSAAASEQHKIDAETAAGAASISADNAAASESNADGFAQAAHTSQQLSAQSADDADDAAQAAADIKSAILLIQTDVGEKASSATTQANKAETEAGYAEASASQAATSEENAEDYKNLASASEQLAAQSADDANDALIATQGHAETAETKADEAGQSAMAAEAHEVAARFTDIASLPSDFSQGGSYFAAAVAGAPTSLTPIEAGGPISFPTVSGVKVLRVSGNTAARYDARQIGVIVPQPGHRYRASMLVRCTVLGSDPRVQVFALGLDASWAYAGDGSASSVAWSPTTTPSGWHLISVEIDGDVAIAGGAAALTGFMRIFGNGTYNVRSLGIADITDLYAAKQAAGASADSAEAAGLSVTDAGVQAEAARTAKTAAETARSHAETYEQQASGARDDAQNAAAAAQQSMLLTAQIGSGAINPNPVYADWPDGQPRATGWDAIGSPTSTTRVAGIDSPYAVRMVLPSGGSGGWVQTGVGGLAHIEPGKYVLEADVEVVSNNLTGAGLIFDGLDSTGAAAQRINVNLATELGSGQPGKIYRLRKMVEITAATTVAGRLYWMSGWPTFGPVTGKVLHWHRCGVRPASDAEAASGQIDDLAASISDQAGVLADLETRTATAYWRRAAQAGGAEAVIEAVATLTNGQAASAVNMSADVVTIGGARTLEVSDGRVIVRGDLSATSRIQLGVSGNYWDLAYRSKDYSISDGTAVNFGVNLGSLPALQWSTQGLVPLAAGETYNLYADNLTATGFTARLKINVPGAPSSITLSTDAAGGSGEPTRVMNKGANADSTDDTYQLSATGTITVANREAKYPGSGIWFRGSGLATVSIWQKRGGVWSVVATETIGATNDVGGFGEYLHTWTITNTYQMGSAIQAFGVSIGSISGDTTIAGVGDISSVSWVVPGTASGTRSATPDGQTTKVRVTPQ